MPTIKGLTQRYVVTNLDGDLCQENGRLDGEIFMTKEAALERMNMHIIGGYKVYRVCLVEAVVKTVKEIV